jgi:predicted SAM-dependent methyltransferase
MAAQCSGGASGKAICTRRRDLHPSFRMYFDAYFVFHTDNGECNEEYSRWTAQPGRNGCSAGFALRAFDIPLSPPGTEPDQKRKSGLSAKNNLGSGTFVKTGYLNVDLFPGGDLTLDLRRGLPFESNCCERIISEHFFEHLEYPDVVGHLLQECCRVLKPGGELRISVPDTEWPLHDYALGENASYFEACRKNSWHPAYCKSRIEHINDHFRQKGEHRFAYDFETLANTFREAGFVDVNRGEFDPGIDSEHRRIGSLVVSGRKSSAPAGK